MKHRGLIISALLGLALMALGLAYFVAPVHEKSMLRAYLGDGPSQMYMARVNLLGEGRRADPETGAKWAARAAKSLPQAQYLLGILQLGGIGTPQDIQGAIKTLEQSNYPLAQQLAAGLIRGQAQAATLLPNEAMLRRQRHEQDLKYNLRRTLAMIIYELEKSVTAQQQQGK